MTITVEKPIIANNHLVLTGITWSKFEEIEAVFQGLGVKRFIYLDGKLEIIMNLGREHEYYKRTISLLLEGYFKEKGIRFYSGGSATLGNKEITGCKEPDESYNIHSKKDLPDLIIEVIVTSGSIEILEIYRRIGIPEVWIWEDGFLTIYVLNNQEYNKLNQSQLLPELDINLLIKYINYHDQYDAVTEFINQLQNL
jgi:Uma2 family endonuclease